MKEFAGKVAVVTGAASGMGRAFAERFAAEGMAVVLADVEPDPLEGAVAELRSRGYDVLGVQTDVSDRAAVERLARAVLDRYGAVHLVVNNAGVEGYMDGPIWEATEKDWAWTMGVNFWGVVHGVQTFLPIMLRQGAEGHLVNTVSMTALVPSRSMYGITKHAVLALTETVRNQLQERGAPIGVSALCPGLVATRLFQGSRNRPPHLQNERPPAEAEAGRRRREEMHRRLATSGMKPSEVADILVRGIRENRLYILTDHDWDEDIRKRAQAILQGSVWEEEGENHG